MLKIHYDNINAYCFTEGSTCDEIEVIQDVSRKKHAETSELKDLFFPRIIALRTANMFYQWFAVVLVFYGLSFSSTDLSGDPHKNFIFNVAIDIPGNI